METIKKNIEFVDANNHRARVQVEITTRNGYPEFTMSGQYLGGYGQVIDGIKPANEAQKELVNLHKKYHLKDVSKMHNFKEHLEGILARVEYEETHKEDKKLEGDEAILESMSQEGIAEDSLNAVKAYIAIMGDDDLKDFEEAYCGEFGSDEDFAKDQAESIGAVDNNASWPNNCIDWEEASKQLMQDYNEQDGFYFRSM